MPTNASATLSGFKFYVEACCLMFRTVLAKKENGRCTIKALKLLEGIEFDRGRRPTTRIFCREGKTDEVQLWGLWKSQRHSWALWVLLKLRNAKRRRNV
jgi:hypothetical protein